MNGKGSGLFRALAVAVLLAAAVSAAWYGTAQYRLRAQIDDLTRSVQTSRQRERKQTYEYDQVVAQIPLTEASITDIRPFAEAALATRSDLREQRRTLREHIAETEAALAAAEEGTAELRARLESLEKRLNSMLDRLK